MDSKTKKFLRKVFDLGIFHSKSSNKLKKEVMKTIMADYDIMNTKTSLDFLEKFLASPFNFTSFCIKLQIDTTKAKYKIEKTGKLLKYHKETKELLKTNRVIITEMKSDSMFWLEAIHKYRKSLKNNK
jgi:hypothetical protein